MSRRPTPVEQRFWPKVQKTDTCWVWTAATTGHMGYGVLGRLSSDTVLAHRLSWEMHNGPIPEGMCVLHVCDNPRCVRPDHLRLGTVGENQLDMARKGRAPRGEKQPGHKLTAELVMWLRRWFRDERTTKGGRALDKASCFASVAATLGVSEATVRDAIKGRTWQHVEG